MNNDEFIAETKKIGINLTTKQIIQLENYYELLSRENQKLNLTRIITKEDVYLKHFFDSLTVSKIIELDKKQTLCDVGSGAGFPGIALKIVFPKLEVTLIEATNKKVDFLNMVIKNLALQNIKAICSRAEDYQGKHDIVVARALAKLNILLELCLPITKINGYFIAMKANAKEEVKEAANALKILNGEIIKIEEIYFPKDNIKRNLIKIKKKQDTPEIYPRKFNKIIKNPL